MSKTIKEEYQKDFLNDDGSIPNDIRASYIAESIAENLIGSLS